MTRPIAIAYFFFQLIIPCFLFRQGVEKHKVKTNDESFTYYLLQPKPRLTSSRSSVAKFMSEKRLLGLKPTISE
jgi:hypothetical protein